MERKALTCSQCGAPASADRCEYCGAVFSKAKTEHEDAKTISKFNLNLAEDAERRMMQLIFDSTSRMKYPCYSNKKERE